MIVFASFHVFGFWDCFIVFHLFSCFLFFHIFLIVLFVDVRQCDDTIFSSRFEPEDCMRTFSQSEPTRLLSSLQGASLSQQHRGRCHRIQGPYRQYPQVPTVSLVPCPTLLNTVPTHITHHETHRVATKSDFRQHFSFHFFLSVFHFPCFFLKKMRFFSFFQRFFISFSLSLFLLLPFCYYLFRLFYFHFYIYTCMCMRMCICTFVQFFAFFTFFIFSHF